MRLSSLASARAKIAHWLPERHIFVRSGERVSAFAISTRVQVIAVSSAAVSITAFFVISLWLGIASLTQIQHNATIARLATYYERMDGGQKTHLETFVKSLDRAGGSLEAMVNEVERRQAALAWLLQSAAGSGKAPSVLGEFKPLNPKTLADRSLDTRLSAVARDQDRLLTQIDGASKSRADRMRMALRLAGLDTPNLAGRTVGQAGVGGPLAEARDPRALAAVLDVDPAFAQRIQHAAQNLGEFQRTAGRAQNLPLARPVDSPVVASVFGVRFDPFTHRPAFHEGQDFPEPYGTPVVATAAGQVIFIGQRTGYGNVVEIEHAAGFMTRYAHLSAIGVRQGQQVSPGVRIGAVGSTGRSTGPHLHYEIWENGRVLDPTKFIKAGDDVHQTH